MTAIAFCILFALWPVLAFLGGLGFAPFTGLAALVTSPASLPRLRLRPYMFVLLAFLAYAAISAMWSPQPLALIEADFAKGRFAVRSEVLRIGLLLLAGGALIAAAQSVDDRGRRVIARVAIVALLVQVAAVILLAIFERQAIAFFYGARPDDEGVQNISRNSLIMAAAAPFLVLGLMPKGKPWPGAVFALVVVAAEVAVLVVREVQAGLLAMIASLICIAIVRLFPRQGFRILGGLVALLVMSAPVVFRFLSNGADAVTATNSIEYRQAIWRRVLEIMDLNPIIGNGVGVLRTYREMITEGVFTNQYYVPNHAHSMPVQLWAETGAVGATLFCAAIIAAALRLPQPGSMGPAAPRIAALVGGFVAISCVSFDLWNEMYWATCVLLAVLVVIWAPSRRADGAIA